MPLRFAPQGGWVLFDSAAGLATTESYGAWTNGMSECAPAIVYLKFGEEVGSRVAFCHVDHPSRVVSRLAAIENWLEGGITGEDGVLTILTRDNGPLNQEAWTEACEAAGIAEEFSSVQFEHDNFLSEAGVRVDANLPAADADVIVFDVVGAREQWHVLRAGAIAEAMDHDRDPQNAEEAMMLDDPNQLSDAIADRHLDLRDFNGAGEGFLSAIGGHYFNGAEAWPAELQNAESIPDEEVYQPAEGPPAGPEGPGEEEFGGGEPG